MSTENTPKLNESLLAAFNRVVSSKSGNLFAEAKKLNEVSDTEIMNSPEYKNALKSLKGGDPTKIQIGQDIEGLGKFEKGDTIWSKVKAKLAAPKETSPVASAAPPEKTTEPPKFDVKQSVPGATPAPSPKGGFVTDRNPSDNSWVQDSNMPANTTTAPTKPSLTGAGGMTGTNYSDTDRRNLELDRDKSNERLKMQRAGRLPGTGL
jgi:hypothetical protein